MYGMIKLASYSSSINTKTCRQASVYDGRKIGVRN